MKLWTAYLDYMATGEGRSIMAYIGQAETEEQLREDCAQALGAFYAENCFIEQGLDRNPVVTYLFREQLLDSLEQSANCGRIAMHSVVHFNFS